MKEQNIYKDPALLWYPKDFISETQLSTMEERGILMTLRASFFVHGRLTKEKIEMLIGGLLSANIEEFLRVDSNGNYYCPVVEEGIRKRREYKKGRSEDGKKGNEVKRLMKEFDIPVEEAREILRKKGIKFGKDKYSGNDTGSVRNKVNAIGDTNENDNSILDDIIFKQENRIELTREEEEVLEMNGLNYVGQFNNI